MKVKGLYRVLAEKESFTAVPTSLASETWKAAFRGTGPWWVRWQPPCRATASQYNDAYHNN